MSGPRRIAVGAMVVVALLAANALALGAALLLVRAVEVPVPIDVGVSVTRYPRLELVCAVGGYTACALPLTWLVWRTVGRRGPWVMALGGVLFVILWAVLANAAGC
jgi:hypothetical protein